MSPESFLKLSQIAIAIGLVISAIGGYGAYHFKNVIENKDKSSHNHRLSEINNKLDELITRNPSLSEPQKQNILDTVTSVEKTYLENLKNKFNLGYALLYVDKENWYYVPRNLSLKVDWFSTKVISLTDQKITILLPNFSDTNHNQFQGNSVTMTRKPGNTVTPFRIGSIQVVVQYLSTENGNATIAVGFQEIFTK